jgi:WD40 repeat protein
LWRVADGALLETVHDHHADIHGLQVSPDGRHLASAGIDGQIMLWRLEY